MASTWRNNRRRKKQKYPPVVAATTAPPPAAAAPTPPAALPPQPAGRQSNRESLESVSSSARSFPLEYSDTSEEHLTIDGSFYSYGGGDGDDDEQQQQQNQQGGGGGGSDRRRQFQNHAYHNDSLSSGTSSPPPSPSLSHFRTRHDSITQSTRVVRLTSNSSHNNTEKSSEQDDEENQHRHQRSPLLSSHPHHRRAHPTASTPTTDNWMTQLALSFRSPQVGRVKTIIPMKEEPQLEQEPQRKADNNMDEWTPLLLQQSSKPAIAEEEEEQQHRYASQQPPRSNKRPSNTKKKRQRTSAAAAATTNRDEEYVEIAAAFLQDYEANRPPSLYAGDLSLVTNRQLRLHQFKFSRGFTHLLWLAVGCMFVSSGMESVVLVDPHRSIFVPANTNTNNSTTYHPYAASSNNATTALHSGEYAGGSSSDQDEATYQHRVLFTALNVFALVVFAVDLLIRHELRKTPETTSVTKNDEAYGGKQRSNSAPLWDRASTQSQLSGDSYSFRNPSAAAMGDGVKGSIRPSRSQHVVKPLILFGILLALENASRIALTEHESSLVLLTSVFKPLIFFYVSYQARNALEALGRIIRIVVRVIFMELLLILMFAAVAVRLFNHSSSFDTLSRSWLSLFELSTTVVNPSLWMIEYRQSHTSAFFFIFFVVVSVFYFHSLVLSVVFQTYIHAASELHERSAADREDAVHLAYLSLVMQQQQNRDNDKSHQQRHNVVELSLVRQLLELMRPHYNTMKINALVEIVASPSSHHSKRDKTNTPVVDYPTFRTKIRQALNASIRTPRSATALAMTVEFLAIAIAIVNFVYVLLVSSAFHQEWFDRCEENLGSIITLVAGFELLIRFNPLRVADFTPLTRLDATFDGLALLGVLVSGFGIVLRVTGRHVGTLDYILTGRAIDMIRIMRFFPVFRDVVRRSADVFPALLGPAILVITTLHLFVYVGMALWGGAVHVGMHDEITPLYDQNNFNSYSQGMVTMFQILVVNDWHAIAEVFLYADRCNSPLIVYPFFVTANLVCVSIMLNVLTAFFVETFVTKINEDSEENSLERNSTRRDTDGLGFNIHRDRRKSIGVRQRSPAGSSHTREHDNGSDADSEGSSENEFLEFDVYEREGFDKIMQTVACGTHDRDFAQNICDYLEIYESLTPGRETVGYLICDQLTLERYGNRRFQNMAQGFLEVNDLHVIVTDMHAELLALAPKASFVDRSLIRTFQNRDDVSKGLLEISAALIRRHPALSLFVSRVNSHHN